jgi:hypothetical protein
MSEETKMVDASTQTNKNHMEKPKIERYSFSEITNQARSQTTSGRKVKRANYNETSSGDEEERDSPLKKKKSNQKDEKIIGTCIPVFRIPYVMQKLQSLMDDGSEDIYDSYAIETLLLNCALDVYSFKNENDLFGRKFLFLKIEYVRGMVMDNEDFKISSKSWSNPLPKPTYDEENDTKVISAYNDLINSEENQKLAYWKRDSSLMKGKARILTLFFSLG